MKVLWFTNTPSAASESLGKSKHLGGWLASLELQLTEKDDVEMGVSFYMDEDIADFKIGNTLYFPIFRKNMSSKLKRMLNRAKGIAKSDEADIPEALKVIEKFKPDVIHVHGTEDNFGLILKHHVQVPVVISIQGILGPIAEKFFAGISMHVANKYEGLKNRLMFKSAALLYKNMKLRVEREKEYSLLAKNIIGRTDWDKKVTRVLAPDSTYFVGNEILRSSFYTATWEKDTIDTEKVKIVTLLSPALYKGLETVMKTAAILAGYKNMKFEWVIIGVDAGNPMVGIVQNWLKLSFKQLNVKFLGQKSEEEVLSILLSADVFCQTSHIENSSNSLCEAMLIGMPIAATNVGGTSSMLEDKNEGFLAQEGEPYSLAGCIVELVNNWQTAIKYGQNAREKALKRHDKNSIVNDLVTVYQKLIA